MQGCGAQSGDRRGDCCKSEPTEPVGVSPTHLEERFLVPAGVFSSSSPSTARSEIRGRRQADKLPMHLVVGFRVAPRSKPKRRIANLRSTQPASPDCDPVRLLPPHAVRARQLSTQRTRQLTQGQLGRRREILVGTRSSGQSVIDRKDAVGQADKLLMHLAVPAAASP